MERLFQLSDDIYKSQLEKLTLMTGFVVQGHISHIVSVSHCNLDFFCLFYVNKARLKIIFMVINIMPQMLSV